MFRTSSQSHSKSVRTEDAFEQSTLTFTARENGTTAFSKYPGSLLRGKTFEGERPPSLMERLFSIVAPPLGRDRLPYAPRSSPAPLQLDRVRTSEMYRQPISSAPLSRCDRSVREKVAVRPLVTSVRVIYVRRVRVIRVTAPSGP